MSSRINQDPLVKARQLLYKGQHQQVNELLDGVLADAPNNIDALYMKAVSQRYCSEFDAALSTLALLKEQTPEFGRAYQEEGYVYREKGQIDKALNAFRLACEFNSALEASWRAQADIYKQRKQSNLAEHAYAQAKRLQALPKELVSVTHLTNEGKLLKAEKLCKQYMMTDKQNVEGMRLLAEIARRLNAMDEAEFLLSSALEIEPNNIQVRIDYIQLLRRRQKFSAAFEQAKQLYDGAPDNSLFQSLYAIECMQVGKHKQALGLFDSVLEKLPNDVSTLASRGHALKTLGEHEQAVQSYQQAYKIQPTFSDAYYALANLKTYRFSDTEIESMSGLVMQQSLPYRDRINCCFALGKAYEDRRDFANSFEYYQKGNSLRQSQSKYDADSMHRELQSQIQVCSKELFVSKKGVGCPAPDPIFIVGLPRAGSTLLEQILASHSQIDGTFELPNILAISHQLRGHNKAQEHSKYPQILQSLNAEELAQLGQSYIDDTRIHRQQAPFFLDKMPNNFRHIGLIHLILPNAKIIDARRNPMACCFSGFKQLFAEGQEFTYGLTEVGRYYRDYVELMQHWDTVLPGKVLRVQYEDVVSDLEQQVRRLLDFLQLPFETDCVNFHSTERAVRTASSEQVRQPIYKEGLEQWRHFEACLDPLKESLGQAYFDYKRN